MDITDPLAPVFAGSYEAPGIASRAAIAGDYAYVANGGSGLQVLDVSDPTDPTLAGSYDTPGLSFDVAVSGDYAYVADGYPAILVIDISDPTTPGLAGSCSTASWANGIAISGDHALVANGTGGLYVVDITDPTAPVPVGSYNTPGNAGAVDISGDYAYLADYSSGLQVLDISDPTTPVLAGTYDTSGNANDVTVSGDRAYVADGTGGLLVLDISDPTNPVLDSDYDTGGDANGVTISGDYAYVADGNSGLQVIGVYQRQFDVVPNVAWSLPFSAPDEVIVGARLKSNQADSIQWEVSADSGAIWQEFMPGGVYQNFISPGSDYVWRSSHFYASAGVNPACSRLEIEWLYEFAQIDSIVDVPGDQGRQVRIHWSRSGHDVTYGPIVEYAIYRRIDQGPAMPGGKTGPCDGHALLSFYPPGDWDFVTSVPAATEETYATVVPTLADSSISGGMQYTTFFIRAMTETLGIHFDSYPDSGYSVDNLAPAPPLNLDMTSPTDLVWEESEAEDFNYFTVYGSAAPELDTAAVLIDYTTGTAMDVAGELYEYYHVTVTDFSGNEGEASSVQNTYAGLDTDETPPHAYALKPSRPNPFESWTKIAFDLPEPCAVRLEVIDIQGRVVNILTDEAWSAGSHSVVWTGENAAGEVTGPGVYFVRMKAGEYTSKTKMLRFK